MSFYYKHCVAEGCYCVSFVYKAISHKYGAGMASARLNAWSRAGWNGIKSTDRIAWRFSFICFTKLLVKQMNEKLYGRQVRRRAGVVALSDLSEWWKRITAVLMVWWNIRLYLKTASAASHGQYFNDRFACARFERVSFMKVRRKRSTNEFFCGC